MFGWFDVIQVENILSLTTNLEDSIECMEPQIFVSLAPNYFKLTEFHRRKFHQQSIK